MWPAAWLTRRSYSYIRFAWMPLYQRLSALVECCTRRRQITVSTLCWKNTACSRSGK